VFNIDNDWKQYTAVYQVGDAIPNHTRLSFVLGNSREQVWLADIQLRPGGKAALPPEQSLEKSNIALPLISQTPAGQDALEYLSSLEVKHEENLRDYLRTELKMQQPIIGSQPLYGGLSGVW